MPYLASFARREYARASALLNQSPRYEYKFVRDGEWMPDLLAHENVWNRQGTLNSVIEVRA
jgi:hypothetical protein